MLSAAVRCLASSSSSSFSAERAALSTCAAIRTRYDPRVFRDPITDRAQLDVGVEKDDERSFLYIKAMKVDDAPVFYRNHVVDKLIRVFMNSGRKLTVRSRVHQALENVKRRQYKEWAKASDEEEKAKIELDPFKIAELAIRNCRPMLRLKPCSRGGVTYQIPFPIDEDESEFRALKMMRDVCRQRAKKGQIHLEDILALELIAASKNEGQTIQAKQEFHKLCEANRAFAHYRKM